LLLAPHTLLEPVPHEYVPDPGTDVPRFVVEEDALRVGDRVVLPPADDASPRGGEPVLGEGPAVAVHPDTQTSADGTLGYWEPFNPSTVPFKRSLVLDAVGEDYALAVHDTALRPVPIGGAPLMGRDPFWASYLVRLQPGRAVPIPSVAPDLRVLSLQSDPPASIEVLRNGTDAYFLRSAEGGVRRVTMLVDARTSYFAPRILPGLTVRDVARDWPVRLPRSVREAARTVHEKLALGPDQPLDRTLERLVGHFRSFDAGALDRATGDVYLDLALGGRGACRHRAFAFVVTAQALGIPARYVQNEAHAFAEIWLPGSGWGRVDLGGVALALEIEGAADKTMHHAGPDPFPQPAGYARGYSRLTGSVRGLPEDAGAPRALRPDETPMPDPDAPTGSRDQIRVVLDQHATSGIRGEPVHVAGRLVDLRGNPAAALRVDAYLSPDGERRGLLVGSAHSDTDGRWRIDAVVPADAPVGRYQLFAVTPGDARRAPGRSR